MHFTFALGIVMLIVWLLPVAFHFTPMGNPPVFMYSSVPLKVFRLIVSVATGVFLFVNFFNTPVPLFLRMASSYLMLMSLAPWAALWAICLGEGSYLPMENRVNALVYVIALPAAFACAAIHAGNWILLILTMVLILARWLCARPFFKTLNADEGLNAD